MKKLACPLSLFSICTTRPVSHQPLAIKLFKSNFCFDAKRMFRSAATAAEIAAVIAFQTQSARKALRRI